MAGLGEWKPYKIVRMPIGHRHLNPVLDSHGHFGFPRNKEMSFLTCVFCIILVLCKYSKFVYLC